MKDVGICRWSEIRSFRSQFCVFYKILEAVKFYFFTLAVLNNGVRVSAT
jgi:hypothetical protein